jgi:branched-chain amino acid transport system ATP-binding protein
MSNILSIRNLEAYYGPTKVLHGIDIDVEEGAVTALLGSNGAGKTSTLRAISGLVKRCGTITYLGVEIQNLSTERIAREGIAHVPDGRGTFGTLTVEENLRVGAYTQRNIRSISGELERIYGYFPRLKERRRQTALTLSGGEQQMLAIGRALMLAPKLLILDEPSFGLAPLIVQEIFRIMENIVRAQNVSILLVEQNAKQSLDLAHFAYVIETGKIVLHGDANTLKSEDAIKDHYLGV